MPYRRGKRGGSAARRSPSASESSHSVTLKLKPGTWAKIHGEARGTEGIGLIETVSLDGNEAVVLSINTFNDAPYDHSLATSLLAFNEPLYPPTNNYAPLFKAPSLHSLDEKYQKHVTPYLCQTAEANSFIDMNDPRIAELDSMMPFNCHPSIPSSSLAHMEEWFFSEGDEIIDVQAGTCGTVVEASRRNVDVIYDCGGCLASASSFHLQKTHRLGEIVSVTEGCYSWMHGCILQTSGPWVTVAVIPWATNNGVWSVSRVSCRVSCLASIPDCGMEFVTVHTNALQRSSWKLKQPVHISVLPPMNVNVWQGLEVWIVTGEYSGYWGRVQGLLTTDGPTHHLQVPVALTGSPDTVLSVFYEDVREKGTGELLLSNLLQRLCIHERGAFKFLASLSTATTLWALPKPACETELESSSVSHWLSDLRFSGKRLEVLYTGKLLGTDVVAKPIHVDVSIYKGLLEVTYRRNSEVQAIQPQDIRPRHPESRRDTGVYVILDGLHTGCYARRIASENEDLFSLSIINYSPGHKEILTGQTLLLSRDRLCIGYQTRREQQAGTFLMKPLRASATSRKCHIVL